MREVRMHLLYLTAEQWPTFRPDIVALFGKYLPRYGVTSDLVTERDIGTIGNFETPWGGGQALLRNVPRNRAGQYWVKFWHNLCALINMDAKKYDAIQVRDMTVTALTGLIVARLKGVPFFYWLSYPQSEGQVARAKARGFKAGMRFWFPLAQGTFGKWLLYRFVLPQADHVFVQSHQMQVDIAQHGIPMAKMTPVPMGVDTEIASPEFIQRSDDLRLVGKRVMVYLGTMDPIRQIEILFQMLAIVRELTPNILLVLVGDTEDSSHRAWLKQEARRLGVTEYILWAGWLPASQAWGYVRVAEIGLSPIPRGYLLDMGSPTKAVEYMALGLPVVANDNPDQAMVIEESGAGICVPLHGKAFAEAVVGLLKTPETMRRMGVKGRQYVASNRGYDSIARAVASVYKNLGETAIERHSN